MFEDCCGEEAVIKGETVFSGAPHPGTNMRVLRSAAGFYIGYLDKDGLPYSRESRYFPTACAAGAALTLVLSSDNPTALGILRQ
jgi:hypothetical protein